MRPRHVLAVLTVGLAACGPIAYVNEVTRRADSAVEDARKAEADKYAPYWWTRANEYLHKARVNAARADFQGANRWGRLATEAAEKAIVEAKDPSKRPIDPGAPEKDEGKGKGKEAAPAKDAEAPRDKAAPPAKDAAPAKGAPQAKDAEEPGAKDGPAKKRVP